MAKWRVLAREYKGVADEIRAMRLHRDEIACRARELDNRVRLADRTGQSVCWEWVDEIAELAGESAALDDAIREKERFLDKAVSEAYAPCPFRQTRLRGVSQVYRALGLD